MAETVTITAEMRDEVSAPVSRAAAAVETANQKVAKSASRAASGVKSSSSRMGKSMGDVGSGAGRMARATERAKGGIAKVWGGMSGMVTRAGAKVRSAAEKAGESAGRGMGERMSRIFDITVGNLLAKGIAGIGSLVSGAISGGMSRLTGIEDAQAKLRGLGNDAASVDTIMGNALASVEGTSFGLGEAATVAGTAVAAGVKPGKDLERMLSAVSNSAAASGSDMGEMGSIFNKVATSGKAQMDVLNQVADRGLPIFTALADELGVTSDEAQKMASAGKVGFAEFERAMVSASGTVAKEMGTTFTGTLSRFRSAFSRVGATLLGPVLEAAKSAMNGLIPIIDAANKALQPVMERVSAWLGRVTDLAGKVAGIVRDLGSDTMSQDLAARLGLSPGATAVVAEAIGSVRAFFSTLKDGATLADGASSAGVAGFFEKIALAINTIRGMNINWGAILGGGALAGVLVMVRNLGGPLMMIGGLIGRLSPLLGGLGGAFRFLLGPVGLIAGLLIAAYASSEQFRTAIQGILPVLMGLVAQVAGALLPVFSQLVTAILPVLVGLFAQIAPILGQVLAAVVPVVGQLLTALVPVLVQIITAILPVFAQLLAAVVPVLGQLLMALLPIIPPVAELIGVFGTLIAAVLTPIMPLISAVASLLTGVLKVALGALTPVIEGVLGVFSGFVSWLSGTLGPMIERVSGWFRGLGDLIGGAVNGLKDFAANPMGGVQDWLGFSGGGVVGMAGGGVLGASGGVIAGHNPGRDTVPIMASRGESVLVPELTRALGAGTIQAANWAASHRKGGTGTRSAGAGADPVSILSGGGGGGNVTVMVDARGASGVDVGQLKAAVRAAVNEAEAEKRRRRYR